MMYVAPLMITNAAVLLIGMSFTSFDRKLLSDRLLVDGRVDHCDSRNQT